jgi:hypothetical protein
MCFKFARTENFVELFEKIGDAKFEEAKVPIQFLQGS